VVSLVLRHSCVVLKAPRWVASSLGAALNGIDSASFTQGARAEEARKDVENWLSELDETLSRRGAANSIDFVSTGLSLQ
jgi:hypothetical protein